MAFLGTDRFKLVRHLGAGGMGIVYEVFDLERGVPMALKCVQTDDGQSLMQLKREFRSLCDLTHPNLVTLGELVEDRGQWFFTMELVKGLDFRRYVRPCEAGTARAEVGSPTDTVGPTPLAASPSSPSHISGSDVATARLTPGHTAHLAERSLQSQGLLQQKTPAQFDETRLRDALRQLGEALAALHADEKVHLDIKPSNLLVTPAGRVVLLDFGLVRLLSRSRAAPHHVVGTPAYMAPEQLAGGDVGAAADWYSVGVLLYEALTGDRPPRAEFRVRAGTDGIPVPAPAECVDGVPEDLGRLCMELLRLNPSERPREWEILQRLGAAQERRGGRAARTEAELSFTGRTSELERLSAALEEALGGAGHTVIVQGESGLGKTALVKQFCLRAGLKHPELLVLHGRCHAREAVPFRAVDGIVDGLLSAAPEDADAAVAALSAAERRLLEASFPVLIRDAIPDEAPTATRLVFDPQERRQRMFAAMRALFAFLSQRRPLLLVIDDLHWADEDSLALLREVLRAPRAPFLLLATVRDPAATPWMPRAREGGAPLGSRVDHLLLQPLPTEDAARLAAQLMERGWASAEAGMQVAMEARGHPLFIRELARAELGTSRKGVQLDLVLRERIGRIPADERRLMSLLSVSESPLPNDVVRTALGASAEIYASALQFLQREQLVRASGLRRADSLEPFHDKIRQAALAELTEDERVDGHERLAVALEATPGADAAALATHWLGAGDKARALGHAARAAGEAEKALAFERAASLLRLCLELLPPGADSASQRVTFHWRLGRAHSAAGKGKPAADAFLGGVPYATAFDRVELQRLAGAQCFLSGHYSEGVDAMRAAVSGAGLYWPATMAQRLRRIFGRRLRERFRKGAPSPRPYSREELQQLDLCWAMVSGMSFTDTILGVSFKGEHLERALACEDAPRRLRALAIEYPFSIAERHRETAEGQASLRAARQTAEEIGTPQAHGFVDMAELLGRVFVLKGLAEAKRLGQSAEERLQSGQEGFTWELQNAILYHNNVLSLLGDWTELAEREERQLQEARARGDRAMVADLCVRSGTFALLARDDADEIERRLAFIADLYPKGRFLHIPLRIGEVLSHANLGLYRWNLEQVARIRATVWQHVGGNLFIRTPVLRYICTELSGRAGLAAATNVTGSARRRELHAVRRTAKALGKMESKPAHASAAMLEAGCAILEQQPERAYALLLHAEQLFESESMAMNVACLRVHRGRLLGGSEGQALEQAGLSRLEAEAKCPEKILRMLTPFHPSSP